MQPLPVSIRVVHIWLPLNHDWQIDAAPSVTILVYTHTHTLTPLCIMLVVMMRSNELNICSHAASL